MNGIEEIHPLTEGSDRGQHGTVGAREGPQTSLLGPHR